MIKKIAFLFSLLIFTTLHAQNKSPQFQLTGQVTEQKSNKSIPYATITLQTDSAKLVKKLSSDASGKFTLAVKENQKYRLIVSAIGFKELSQAVELTGEKTNLGTLKLDEGAALKEVSVVAQKPLVKVDVDKITYSIESDPESKTSNGLEILRKVPLLNVDGDENITLNGQSNYKVLVNGKSNSMMSKNFKEVIKSLPANSIKDIEVITSPSSKYEAEGVGGIINIITMKKTMNGYNGSVNTGFDSRGSANASLYTTAKLGKFSLSGQVSSSQNKQPESGGEGWSVNNMSPVYHKSTSFSRRKYSGNSNSFSGDLGYEIDSLRLLSMSFWGYSGSSDNSGYSWTDTKDTSDIKRTRYFRSDNNGKSNYFSIAGNIDYQKTYKKPDKTFTVSYKFDTSPYTSTSTTGIDAETAINYTPYTQRSESKNRDQEHTFQVDYYDPLSKKHQIECGVKAIYRGSIDNSDLYRNDSLKTDKSNELGYDQYILGAYGGYVFKLKKFTAKSGLRIERTWNEGRSESVEVVHFSNRLFNLVPYITLSYQIKPGQTIKTSYTQRLQRPSVWYLNPYVDRRYPMYIRYGNPNLESEISHSFDLSYSLFTSKFSFNSSLSAAINNNSIEHVSSMDSASVTTSTYENIGVNQRFSYNGYASYRMGTKFNVYSNFSSSFAKYESFSNGFRQTNEGLSYRVSLGFSVQLWKNANFNANGNYSSPNVFLQGKSSGYSYSSLGLSQALFKRKMSINLNVSEPFREKRTYIYDIKGNGYEAHNEGFSYARMLRLSVSYNFGKMDISVKKAKRGISNDDRKAGSGN